MAKVIKERFVVKNKRDKTYVDVEVIERATQSGIERESDEYELELDDIDFVQLQDNAPTRVASPPTRHSLSQQQRGNSQAMVLFSTAKPPKKPEDLETIISSVPTNSLSSRLHKVPIRLLSYVGVAAVSITGTWLVIGLQNNHTRNAEVPEASILRISDQTLETTHRAPAPPSFVPKTPAAAEAPTSPKENADKAKQATTASSSTQKKRVSFDRNERVRAKPTHKRKGTEKRPESRRRTDKPAAPESSKKASTTLRQKHKPDSHQTEQKTAHTPAAPSSPKSLSKSLVRKTMERFDSTIQQCKGSLSGRVVVELIISGATGEVISSRAVDQVELGAKTSKCVAEVVQSARFPMFEQSTLKIRYPYIIQ